MIEFDKLIATVNALRSPEGCPWDRAQTRHTLRGHLLEEAYEVVEAIDHDEHDDLQGELGDLLFLIVLMANIAEEEGLFELPAIVTRVVDKMKRRHPHVFDREHHHITGEEGTNTDWERRKNAHRTGSVLDGVPRVTPPLTRAHRIGSKAAAVGFDWPDYRGIRAKLDEEIAEFDEAVASGDDDAIADEMGDLLFTIANLARHLPVRADDALRLAIDKFERRFRQLESELANNGQRIQEVDATTLDAHWEQAKEVLRSS